MLWYIISTGYYTDIRYTNRKTCVRQIACKFRGKKEGLLRKAMAIRSTGHSTIREDAPRINGAPTGGYITLLPRNATCDMIHAISLITEVGDWSILPNWARALFNMRIKIVVIKVVVEDGPHQWRKVYFGRGQADTSMGEQCMFWLRVLDPISHLQSSHAASAAFYARPFTVMANICYRYLDALLLDNVYLLLQVFFFNLEIIVWSNLK